MTSSVSIHDHPQCWSWGTQLHPSSSSEGYSPDPAPAKQEQLRKESRSCWSGVARQQDACRGSWMCSPMMPQQRAGAECLHPSTDLTFRHRPHIPSWISHPGAARQANRPRKPQWEAAVRPNGISTGSSRGWPQPRQVFGTVQPGPATKSGWAGTASAGAAGAEADGSSGICMAERTNFSGDI